MEINSRIALIRPVLNEYFDGPREIIELILTFAHWLFEGDYYTRGDLRNISVGTHTFALNMELYYVSHVNTDQKSYDGEVIVIRDDKFEFKFVFRMYGIQLELIGGRLDPYVTVVSFPNKLNGKIPPIIISLLPYKFK